MTAPAQKPGRSCQVFSTPKDFLDATKRRLGISEFAFDFAANSDNAKARHWWGEEDDSLSRSPQEWAQQIVGGHGFLNPPFADIAPWASRCADTATLGGHIAFLVPAGVGANWYLRHVHRKALVLALNGRLCFIENWQTTIDPATEKPGKGPPRIYASAPLYPKDTLLCLYGPDITPDFDVWNWRA